MLANVLRDGTLICDHLLERVFHTLDVHLIFIRNHLQINYMFPKSAAKILQFPVYAKHHEI